jgi:hypothetical protein
MDQNPYAPPRADPAPDFEPVLGVGAWRHGTLVVLHEEAQLPPLCVKSGVSAPYGLWPIRWTHPLRWPAEHLEVMVALSPRAEFWHTGGRVVALTLALVAASITLAAAAAGLWLAREEAIAPAMLGCVAAIVLFAWWHSLAQPLWLVKRRRKYYWLSGAHKKFLAQLPHWPLK